MFKNCLLQVAQSTAQTIIQQPFGLYLESYFESLVEHVQSRMEDVVILTDAFIF